MVFHSFENLALNLMATIFTFSSCSFSGFTSYFLKQKPDHMSVPVVDILFKLVTDRIFGFGFGFGEFRPKIRVSAKIRFRRKRGRMFGPNRNSQCSLSLILLSSTSALLICIIMDKCL